MKKKSAKKGFTIIEVIVAMGIITLIFSMVYGSYFATSKSARICMARMTTAQQAGDIIDRMAGQIRGCYLAAQGSRHVLVKPGFGKKKLARVFDFFSGHNLAGGQILHMVTSNPAFRFEPATEGLYGIIYKFEQATGELFISRRKFSGLTKDYIQPKNWQLLSDNVSSVELEFFDGRNWYKNWRFTEKFRLPSAVRVGITIRDQFDHEFSCKTTAYVTCAKQQNMQIEKRTLISTNK